MSTKRNNHRVLSHGPSETVQLWDTFHLPIWLYSFLHPTATGTVFLLPHCYWNSFQLKLDDSLQSTVYMQLFALLSCSQFCSVNPILVKVVCAVQSIYCPVYILYILHLSHTAVAFDVVLCTVGHTLVLKPWVLFTGMVLSFLVHREK